VTVAQSLVAFVLAAGVLTITPGLDTALVLRTATLEGRRRAALASLGIVCGCLAWGAAVGFGLGALLAASRLAFNILRWVGAAYLAWLGLQLLLRPRHTLASRATPERRAPNWFLRGVLQNLLNPKVGVFYVSFLPQFVPASVPVGPYVVLLAGIHAALGVLWFAALIQATGAVTAWLRQPRHLAALDRCTGCIFIAFGAKLALSRR
jgi:threonine/homoserine/homoserine lactone efflux protein